MSLGKSFQLMITRPVTLDLSSFTFQPSDLCMLN